jgi:hypothetical protein
MDVVCWLTVEDGADLVVVHQHRDVKRVGAEKDDSQQGNSGGVWAQRLRDMTL